MRSAAYLIWPCAHAINFRHWKAELHILELHTILQFQTLPDEAPDEFKLLPDLFSKLSAQTMQRAERTPPANLLAGAARGARLSDFLRAHPPTPVVDSYVYY